MFVSSHNLVLAAAALASGASALAATPVVNKVTVPTLSLSPLESEIVCLKGEIALAILTKANYQSSAYAFCSSFISIPPVTSSVTVTQTSFTPTTTTVTFTSTVTETLIDTVTVTVTPAAAVKRSVAVATSAVPFQSAIQAINSAIVSAGCSCIETKIPLATTTTTLTKTTTQASPTITAFSTVFETTTVQTTSTVTVNLPGTPDPSCAGAQCNTFKSCSVSSDSCSCYTSAEGPGYCAQDSSCNAVSDCTTSSDCAANQICAVNSCCGVNICLSLMCDNPARMLIKARRQAGSPGRTSRNDGSNTIGGVAA